MAEKKIDLKKLSYADLEKEADEVLKKMNDDTLALDEASKLYQYGRQIAEEMEKRLTELENSVSDTISRE